MAKKSLGLDKLVRSEGSLPHLLELNAEQLVWLVREQGVPIPPTSAVEICVEVPSGGDYSGCRLTFKGAEVAVTFRWKE